MPTPSWQTATGLVADEADAAFTALSVSRPMWATAFQHGTAAWARRPRFILPLDAAASEIDASHVVLYLAEGDAQPLARSPVTLSVELVAERSVVVAPIAALPITVTRGVLAFEPGAVVGARPLGACAPAAAADATPVRDPAYDAAAMDTGLAAVDLAIPFSVARAHEPMVALARKLASAPDIRIVSSRTDGGDGRRMRGVLSLPDYRTPDGVLALGADGAPTSVTRTEPEFVVELPAGGTAPYPFVLFQHGGAGSPDDFDFIPPELLAAGFAVVAIDLPEHGHRAPASGMRGELAFLDFDDLTKLRGNFFQTVADHLDVLAGTGTLNDEIVRRLGFANALDGSRAFYMGLSLGGISGAMTVAVAPSIRSGAIFVGGGGFGELAQGQAFSLFLQNVLRKPRPARDAVYALTEALLAPADPLTYAGLPATLSRRPPSVLLWEAMSDTLVANASTENLARAYAAPIAGIAQHPAIGIDTASLPLHGNVAGATRALIQAPMNDVAIADRHQNLIVMPYAQRAVAHCFTTDLTDGTCELVDTDWASE